MKFTLGFGSYVSFVSGSKDKSTAPKWLKLFISSIFIALMLSSINGWTADTINEFAEDYGIGATNEFTAGQVNAPPRINAIDASDAFIKIATVIEDKLKSMIGNSKITSIGWELFWFFGAANVIYILIRSMLTSGGLHDVLADLIPLGIMAGVVFAFLTKDVGQQIQATMETLGEAITGQRTGALGPLMVQAAATSMETITHIWKIGPTPASPTSNVSAMMSLVTFLPNTLMTVGATIVSVLLVVVALAIYMAHLVTSQISMYIALMFAPFFVPFLLFRPASWLFEGWLRFFVGSLLLKIVGLILLSITSAIMASILDLSKSVGGPGMSAVDGFVFDMTKYSVIILMAALAAYLQSSAPSISAGLLSGGAGGIGFGSWSALGRTGMAARALPSASSGGNSGGARSGGGTTSPSRLAQTSTAAGHGAAAVVRTAQAGGAVGMAAGRAAASGLAQGLTRARELFNR